MRGPKGGGDGGEGRKTLTILIFPSCLLLLIGKPLSKLKPLLAFLGSDCNIDSFGGGMTVFCCVFCLFFEASFPP